MEVLEARKEPKQPHNTLNFSHLRVPFPPSFTYLRKQIEHIDVFFIRQQVAKYLKLSISCKRLLKQ